MSNDLKQQAHEYKKKKKLIAYILWFFFGTLGIHRFYLRRYLSGGIIFLLTLASVYFQINGNEGAELALIAIPMIFMIVDIFYIPRMVNIINTDIALQLGLDMIS